ncbi:MAG: ATP-binding protein [Cytophagaceae bacterium]
MNLIIQNPLESSSNGIFILKTERGSNSKIIDFIIVFANDAFLDHVYSGKGNLVGKYLFKEFPFLVETALPDLYKSVIDTGESASYMTSELYNGSLKWYKIYLTKYEDGLIGNCIDITRERKTELVLKEKEAVLNEVQELASIGSYEWDVVSKSYIWSDNHYRIYGYEPGEVEITDEFSINLVHPEDREYISKIFYAATDNFNYQFRYIRRDRSEGIAFGKGKIIKNEKGEVVKVRGYIQDITERIRLEELLINTQRIAQVGSWNWNLKNNMLSGSPEFFKIFGVPEAEMDIDEFIKTVNIDEVEKLNEALRDAIKGNDPYNHKFSIRVGSEKKYLWEKADLIYDMDGNAIKMLGITVDITELHKVKTELEEINNQLEAKVKERTKELIEANEQLKRINEDLDRFAYTISHDLKSPLNSIEPLIRLIMIDSGNLIKKDSQLMLEMIGERIQHLNTLIRNILDAARNPNRKKEEVNLNNLINDVINSLLIPFNIHILVEHNMPSVTYYKISLIQIFQNLIGNAVKFMDKKDGVIKISHRSSEDFYTICVEDNGIGISEEDQLQIFETFVAGKNSHNIESSGLGLSIVKKIIEDNGGSIWVESAEGEGAKFLFTIPVKG